jgi:hypothetical protein
MCFPLLAAIPAAFGGFASSIGTAASVVGTGVSTVGSIMAGQAAKSQADAQAAAYKQQAANTLTQGSYEANRQWEGVEQTMGQQVALAGGSGVTMDGSVSDVIGSTASSGALDNSAILYGAKVNANNLKYQARLATISGQNALTGSYFSAAGNLFGGLGQLGKSATPARNPNATYVGLNYGET